jgi:hypothetical protein
MVMMSATSPAAVASSASSAIRNGSSAGQIGWARPVGSRAVSAGSVSASAKAARKPATVGVANRAGAWKRISTSLAISSTTALLGRSPPRR